MYIISLVHFCFVLKTAETLVHLCNSFPATRQDGEGRGMMLDCEKAQETKKINHCKTGKIPGLSKVILDAFG